MSTIAVSPSVSTVRTLAPSQPSAATQASTATQTAQPPRYSLAHIIAMPIAFALVLLLTRLAAGL